jgi:hypothetical protein
MNYPFMLLRRTLLGYRRAAVKSSLRTPAKEYPTEAAEAVVDACAMCCVS